jgi:hypothetical protein
MNGKRLNTGRGPYLHSGYPPVHNAYPSQGLPCEETKQRVLMDPQPPELVTVPIASFFLPRPA